MARYGIVAPMRHVAFRPLPAAALALLLACGPAHAQFKAKSKSKEPLGSGLYVPPAEEAPMGVPAGPAKAAPPTEDKRSRTEVIEDIAHCMLQGSVPPDWTRVRVEVIELGREGKERQFEAKYTYVGADGKEAPFSPCDPREAATDMYILNRGLEPEKRNWIRATLSVTRDGKFDLKYDYTKADGSAPAPATPAAGDAATKK